MKTSARAVGCRSDGQVDGATVDDVFKPVRERGVEDRINPYDSCSGPMLGLLQVVLIVIDRCSKPVSVTVNLVESLAPSPAVYHQQCLSGRPRVVALMRPVT